MHCSATRTTFDSTRVGCTLSLGMFSQVRGGAASGNRTPDLLITSEPLCPTELRRRRCLIVRPSVTAYRAPVRRSLVATQCAGQRLDGDPGLDVERQRLAAAEYRFQFAEQRLGRHPPGDGGDVGRVVGVGQGHRSSP